MKIVTVRFKFIAISALLVVAFSGCESTDGGGGNVSGSAYYGVGFYDPWYYGDYYDDPDVIVRPPTRPDNPRPEHPIARPTPPSTPVARPMPSIPSMPRGGGGGRR